MLRLRRSDLMGAGLCVMISFPAYALGHRLREGDPSVALLAGLLLLIVVLSSAIMKQAD